jgi:hypothetical protein
MSSATPITRRSAGAAGISASAPRLLASKLKTLLEETLKRWPEMELLSEPDPVRSLFLNQQRQVHVRLHGTMRNNRASHFDNP